MSEFIGLDVAKKETAYCVMDSEGKILAQGRTTSDPDALFAAIKEHSLCPERIVLETGTFSNWLASELCARGLEATVIDARIAHAVLRFQHNKTDENDAVQLADLARTKYYRAVALKGEQAQKWRMLLKARSHMVGQRVARQNTIRGLLGGLGLRFERGAGTFAKKVHEILIERSDLAYMFDPMVDELEALERAIRQLNKAVSEQAMADPTCRLLMTIPAVGPVTALAYMATIDQADRFGKSRSVGAYVGLTSKRMQTGETDYSGRITKNGDQLLRSLLYGAANNLMSVVRKAHPLKDWARRLKKRSSHKKACVALARKLTVIMHRMIINDEEFRWPSKDNETSTEEFAAA